ncbi:hypothetical protein HPP92_015285 [Vanilla planifolia]|uniref:Fe2OG dioxygenase domain-containing protein n=1 Tax=Vanilla planifolia TaxID=51239 RepID=A0A835UTW8_VANPL|nr:hypothetical protein HPP92_015285 [Vanilla planifolia]
MDFIDGTFLPPPLRRSMYSFLRICLLILMVLVAGSTAKSSVFSLFSLKSKSKFWSESVIRTAFDDLEGSVPSGHGKMEVVNYTKAAFSVHAIQMGEEVTSVFEQAITALSRKEVLFDSRAGEDVVWQVDIDKMAYIFSTLVDYLKIDDTYNIFVLNPKYRNKRLHYGYRRGLSESEINFLKENKTLQALVLQSEHAKGNALEIDNIIPRPLHLNRPASNFVWTTTEEVNTMLHDKKDDLNYLLGEALKSGDFTGLHSECLTDTWIGGNRWAFIDLSAGPFSWGPAVGGEGVRTELSLPNVNKTIGAVAELTEVEAEEKLQDAIRERFSSFDELDERMHDLKSELEGYNIGDSDESHRKKALDALKRMERWNLFSDPPEEYHSYTVAHDTFLAQLGATLWGSMKHIVAPSMADGAYHYYEKISFQIYFITQEKITNMKKLPVNLKAFTDGLSSLAVTSQRLALSDDPALTMAFSVARRAAAVPLLLINGTYRLTTRPYLDSSILQRQLQKLSDHGSFKGTHSDSRRPIKATIAATAEHLAGLLPLHLVYSQAHETAIEDWSWSVGCNPVSITSQGWHLSQLQSDAIARSYINTALEESILAVNAAIHLLFIGKRESPRKKPFKAMVNNVENNACVESIVPFEVLSIMVHNLNANDWYGNGLTVALVEDPCFTFGKVLGDYKRVFKGVEDIDSRKETDHKRMALRSNLASRGEDQAITRCDIEEQLPQHKKCKSQETTIDLFMANHLNGTHVAQSPNLIFPSLLFRQRYQNFPKTFKKFLEIPRGHNQFIKAPRKMTFEGRRISKGKKIGYFVYDDIASRFRPNCPSNFKSSMEEYINLLKELARKIMQGIALALGGPPETFEGEIAGDTFWVMRIIGYPGLPAEIQFNDVGCEAHTDYGLLTLVNQDDDVHALQVRNRAGEWICAVPIPGTFVCNIGDMLKVWSNGLYEPTLHRVVNNSPKYRVSVVFFYEPNFDTAAEPLEFCKEKTSGTVKHQRVVYGEHLVGKVTTNFAS